MPELTVRLRLICLMTLTLLSGVSAAETGQIAKASADFSVLTSAIDFSGILAAILAVAATLVTVYASFTGVKWVLNMVRNA